MSRHHHHRESAIETKLKKNRKAIVTILVCFIVIAACIYVAGVLDSAGSLNPDEQFRSSEATNSDRIKLNGKWYIPKNNVRTTLLLGVDKFGDAEQLSESQDSRQSDFILVLVEDLDEGQYSIIHLNRDTMARIPVLALNGRIGGYANMQLALAYSYGSGREDSCKNSCRAVSEILNGRQIDHFLAFTMDAVPIVNDEVGGVPVLIEDDFSSIDPSLVKGETVVLRGEQALTFVRSRHSMVEDSTNINRMNRQKNYVLSWSERAKEWMDHGGDTVSLLRKVNPYMITDLSSAQLSQLVDQITQFSQGNYYSPEGTLKDEGDYVGFHVDERNMEEIVLKLFYREAK